MKGANEEVFNEIELARALGRNGPVGFFGLFVQSSFRE